MHASWLGAELLLLLLLAVGCEGWRVPAKRSSGAAGAAAAAVAMLLSSTFAPELALAAAKAEEVPLERYFAAVAKELDPATGESLVRIKKDIDTLNWEDLKLFTREYDAGFRGGILKATWKRLGDNKKRGIEVSNSFTFDLIGLNKAARSGDQADALRRYEDVRKDIQDFLLLDPAAAQK